MSFVNGDYIINKWQKYCSK